MYNQEIRNRALKNGIKLYQIADKLHMQDSNFSKKLRKELPEEEKNIILSIIDELVKERESE